MKITGVLFMFLLVSMPADQNDFHEIRLAVTNISQSKGTIEVCLTNSREQFLKNCFRAASKPAVKGSVLFTFNDLPGGHYAFSIYHDENDNGKIDSGLFGIPTEDYGFSNSPSTFFGPPNFEECRFQVRENVEMTIKL